MYDLVLELPFGTFGMDSFDARRGSENSKIEN